MRKHIISFSIILFCLFAFSCKTEHEESAVIPPKQMQSVLWDMYRANIYAQDFIAIDSTKNDSLELIEMKKTIFSKYKVTDKQFEQSYQYYLSHPNQMIAIIDSIQTHSKKQTRAMEKIFRPE